MLCNRIQIHSHSNSHHRNCRLQSTWTFTYPLCPSLISHPLSPPTVPSIIICILEISVILQFTHPPPPCPPLVLKYKNVIICNICNITIHQFVTPSSHTRCHYYTKNWAGVIRYTVSNATVPTIKMHDMDCL